MVYAAGFKWLGRGAELANPQTSSVPCINALRA